MLTKEILKNQQKLQNLELIERDVDFEELESVFKLNKVFALIGSRRSGKTFLIFQILKTLIRTNKITPNQICYLDFSALLDQNITIADIEEAYFGVFPELQPIFVFDEIQELPNFAPQLISLLNAGYNVIITVSNAHMLSRELSTILRGKVYTKEIFPLDFKEYLKFKHVSAETNELIVNKPKYKKYFLDFLQWGGFPEIVLNDHLVAKENILKNYLDVMMYKDLQDRYAIRNDFALTYFIKRVLLNFPKKLTINKIYNELKSQNIQIGKDRLYDFFTYLNDIYLVSSLPNFRAKIKGTPKIYLIDTAFANVVGNMDYGKRLENFVYRQLKKKYGEVYFLSKNYEIDFYIPSEQKYIQVVYDLNAEDREREVQHLLEQEGEKVLIYMEKDKKLIIPDTIQLMSFEDFLN